MGIVKHLANCITFLRMVFAAFLPFTPVFSGLFWCCYLSAGASDILDGIVARRLGQESDFGAKLDSVADLVFAFAVAATFLIRVELPWWLWSCIAGVAVLRIVGYGIGYCKYHTFSALHTYANKATGGAIFLFPVLYTILGVDRSGILLCMIAFASALEELVITVRSKSLHRDCNSIFCNKPQA